MAKVGRGADQFPLRLPEGLRDRIKAAAEKNGRSMNVEIVTVLEEKFPDPQPLDSRVGALLELVTVLQSNLNTKSVNSVVEKIVDTLHSAALGRIAGIPDEVRDSIRDQLDDWLVDQAKEDEIRAHNRAADPEET